MTGAIHLSRNRRNLGAFVIIDRFATMLLCLFSLFLASFSNGWAENEKMCESSKVRLPSRTVDGQVGVSPAEVFENATNNDERIHVLIKFDQPLTLCQHEEIDEHGIVLLEYIENCAYIASMSRSNWLGFAGKSGEIGELLGKLEPNDKVSTDIRQGSFNLWALDEHAGYLEVVISFHRDVTDAQQDRFFEEKADFLCIAQASIRAPTKRGPQSWTALVKLEDGQTDWIRKIAEEDSVRWIEQGPEPARPLLDTARKMVNTDEAQDPGGMDLTGKTTRIGVCDQGVDENHPGLDVYDNLVTSSDFHDHGTSVASIAAGSGAESAGKIWRGHAPDAEIGDYPQCKWFASLYKHAIVDKRTDIFNHSYHQSSTGAYSKGASDIDGIVRGGVEFNNVEIPARPHVWAAGNEGALWAFNSIKAPAKNPIVVGSVDTASGVLSLFSSLGPTRDGRIKPDLVAPGCRSSSDAGEAGIWTAEAGSDDYSQTECGTSYAAPVVSGIIALMMEEFGRTFERYPELRSNLHPATFKAILVNSAMQLSPIKKIGLQDFGLDSFPSIQDLDSIQIHPNYATGFGLVDATGACELISNRKRWLQSSIGASGFVDHWCVSVPSESSSMKVTLAWDDESPGTYGNRGIRKLVNDLDLILISPGETVLRPWTLKPSRFTPDGGIDLSSLEPAKRDKDSLNNVEMASENSPEPGTWHVFVYSFSQKFGTSQPYSLASSHEFLGFCPELSDDLCDLVGILCPPMEVCGKFPGICEGKKPSRPEMRKDALNVDHSGVIRVRDVFGLSQSWPECEGKAWKSCPGFEIILDRAPTGVTIVVFDQKGRILQEVSPASDKTPLRRATIRVSEVYPGQDVYIGFVSPGKIPIDREFSTRLTLTPLRESVRDSVTNGNPVKRK